jgi:hypothetical protein
MEVLVPRSAASLGRKLVVRSFSGTSSLREAMGHIVFWNMGSDCMHQHGASLQLITFDCTIWVLALPLLFSFVKNI